MGQGPGGGRRAQAGGHDHRGPDHAVVVAALEADAAERRVARRDADSEAELVAALGPARGELVESPAHRDCHPDGPQHVVVLEHRVVEEDHHPVAREVLQGPTVLHDELAHRGVIFAQDPEDLFGLGRLAERGEAAQVREQGGRDAPVAGQELGALGARDQRSDLR